MTMVAEASSAASAAEPAKPVSSPSEEKVLCQHCRRTASNGIRCLGMCVADSEY